MSLLELPMELKNSVLNEVDTAQEEDILITAKPMWDNQSLPEELRRTSMKKIKRVWRKAAIYVVQVLLAVVADSGPRPQLDSFPVAKTWHVIIQLCSET